MTQNDLNSLRESVNTGTTNAPTAAPPTATAAPVPSGSSNGGEEMKMVDLSELQKKLGLDSKPNESKSQSSSTPAATTTTQVQIPVASSNSNQSNRNAATSNPNSPAPNNHKKRDRAKEGNTTTGTGPTEEKVTTGETTTREMDKAKDNSSDLSTKKGEMKDQQLTARVQIHRQKCANSGKTRLKNSKTTGSLLSASPSQNPRTPTSNSATTRSSTAKNTT